MNAAARGHVMSAHVVTRADGQEYRVTGATYLGPRESCTNGPLWEVHAERLHDGARAYWHTAEVPTVAIRHCDGTTAPCRTTGCYGHDVRRDVTR